MSAPVGTPPGWRGPLARQIESPRASLLIAAVMVLALGAFILCAGSECALRVWELRVLEWFAAQRSPAPDALFTKVTWLGSLWLPLLLATALVLIAEMMNTAIEALCDFVETRYNEKIRIIKDVAAAAVGMSIAVWAVIVVVDVTRLWPRLFG